MTLEPGDTFPVPPDGLVLGRGATASLRVASSHVARLHLRIVPEGDALRLEDPGSTNGTVLDGTPTTPGAPVLARAGARITLAAAFYFEVVQASGMTKPTLAASESSVSGRQ